MFILFLIKYNVIYVIVIELLQFYRSITLTLVHKDLVFVSICKILRLSLKLTFYSMFFVCNKNEFGCIHVHLLTVVNCHSFYIGFKCLLLALHIMLNLHFFVAKVK